jgi:hypothetical protein
MQNDTVGQERLTPRQEIAAVALASASSADGAARKAGVGVNRVWVWLREEPVFKARVQELRVQLTDRACGIVVEAMADAALALKRLLSSKSELVQLKAADSLLTHGAQLRALAEMQQVQDRVGELESQFKRKSYGRVA